jgi:hypothetical protein
MSQLHRLSPIETAVPTSPPITIEFDRHAVSAILADPAFAELEAYPHSASFGRTYHAAVYGDRDISFAIRAADLPVLVCLCAPLDGTLSFYSLPLRLCARPDLSETIHHAAVQAAFTHLDALAIKHGTRDILVREQAASGLSVIGEACTSRGAQATPLQHACVDLTVGQASWRRALRKSSRSLINWGKRNLEMRFANRESPDRSLFSDVQRLHTNVAGRVTRSQNSWDVMYDFVAAGRGELIGGYLDGELVAGSLFIDGTEICIYASGVYNRMLFDKPLAHYSVWLAIERAHLRGMKVLELGVVHDKGSVSDKEYQIGYFKRGFATHIDKHVVWRW